MPSGKNSLRSWLWASAFALTACLLAAGGCSKRAPAVSARMKEIQAQLAANPLLKENSIKLEARQEDQGAVVLEMTEGDHEIRKGINAGLDIFTTQTEIKLDVSKEQRDVLKALRGALKEIKAIPGVETITLRAAVNTNLSREESLFAKAQILIKSNNPAEAIKPLEEAAALSYAPALCHLAYMYADGFGIAKNETKAMEYYRKAARQNVPSAQYNIATMYYLGHGVKKDEAKAFDWCGKAAAQGFAAAQILLGVMYSKGQGVAKDNAKAIAWYRKAADQEFIPAQIALGVVYYQGQEVAQDDAQALSWFRKAAANGSIVAMRHAGNMYAEGKGAVRSYSKAIEWLSKGAEAGDPGCLNACAWIYATCPVEKLRDAGKALEYVQKAASQSPENGGYYDTLAAAYARNGEFDKAVEAQQKAIAFLKKDTALPREEKGNVIAGAEKRLDLYKKRLPYTTEK
ncbi:MAG: tetratricopeptide repeat protein [Candidatus Sumerlaeota bacterium]|nr:tetratricopeptide repeat protein [Candidatus Sumerlaeota bacterium]